MLFSSELAKANILNLKTETRRVKGLEHINENPDNFEIVEEVYLNTKRKYWRMQNVESKVKDRIAYSPYGQEGDILCQRETLIKCPSCVNQWAYKADGSCVMFDVDRGSVYEDFLEKNKNKKTIPSLHMPDVVCRFKRKIKSVSLERLNSITKNGVINEGLGLSPTLDVVHLKIAYLTLFAEIYGQEFTDRNPWVWVIKY